MVELTVDQRKGASKSNGTGSTELVTTNSTSESDDPQGPIFVCRVAIAAVRVDGVEASRTAAPRLREFSATVEEKLRESLGKDPRVSEVIPLSKAWEVDNAVTLAFFEERAESDSLLDSFERYSAIRLNDPIEFTVRVPVKNQPLYRSMKDVPSDEYNVVWDGITAFVQWRQASPGATGSGGHVVLDVLVDAGDTAGFETKIVPCSPGCLHKFVHADFVTFEEKCAESENAHSHGSVVVGTSVSLPFDAIFDDPRRNLRQTYSLLVGVFQNFAEASTRATEIGFLEGRIRTDTEILLTIAYLRAERRAFPHVIGWVSDAWSLRGSSRESRRLTAGVWLALAAVESGLHMWNRSSERLAELIQEGHMTAISDVFDISESAIEKIDLSSARDAVAEISSRREGRMLIWATAAGAAAAVGGAAIAALLT